MVPIRDEVLDSNPRISGPSSAVWLYLLAEFLIGAALSGALAILGLVKSLLPKPPRDLTGDVVLVTGATSSLGRCIANEFARNGCSIVCLDAEGESLNETTSELTKRYPLIEEIGPRYREKNPREGAKKFKNFRALSYPCDLRMRDDIRQTAGKIKKEIGRIDVLVTCAGQTGQDIVDTVNLTLMSHYWTVLAFLPSLLEHGQAHVIGVTPTTSTEDAYAGSRAAISGLMDSLAEEFSGRSSYLNFITVAPKADPRLLRQSEEQVAKDVVLAVRRNQCTVNACWFSTIVYRMSCALYVGIATIIRWMNIEACDNPH